MRVMGPSTPPVSGAEGVVREAVGRGGGFEGLSSQMERITITIFEDAAAATADSLSTAAAADAVVAGTALGTAADVPVLLIVIAALLLLRALEYGLIALFSFGFWGLGSRLQSGVRHIFAPLDSLENSIIGSLVEAIKGLFHSLTLVVGYFMGQNQGHTAAVATGVNAKYLNYLNQRTMALWAWDSRLQADVTALQKTLSTPTMSPSPIAMPPLPEPPTVIQNTTVTTPVPQNVWDQMSHLASENAARARDIEGLQDQIGSLTGHIATLQREYVTLSQNVHSVRAVSIGLQEMQQEVATISGLVITFIDQASNQFEHQQRELTSFQPLHLLLQLGPVGVQTLRQLQDTPCMCPKIPNIPRLHPELLAMYEFASYG